MKFKRAITLGIISCLTLGLAGCGSSPEGGANTETMQSQASSADGSSAAPSSGEVHKDGLPIVDEQQTLRVLTITKNPEVEAADVVIHQEIEEATNVKIEWTIIPFSAWKEKKGLTLAQTELPDIMLGDDMFTDNDLLNMVEAGQVIPIDDLLADYAPNFNKILENQEGLKEAITNEDGHIYGLPQYRGTGAERGNTSTDRVTYINKTWLDKLDLEVPATTEELKTVLKAFKDGDPNGNGLADEVPLSTFVDNYFFNDWFGAFGLVPSANENKYENISLKDGKVVFSAVEEEYKEAVKYFHELWKEGVVDPETFTQDSAMFNAKLKAETRTVGMFSAWRGTSWRLSPEDEEYVILPPLEGPDGDRMYPELYCGITSRAGLVITSSCQNKELAMRWADYLVSPENGYQFWTKAKIGYNLEDGSERYNLVKKIDVADPEQIRQVMLGFTCVDYQTMNKKPDDPDPLNVDNEKAVSDKIYKPYYPKEHYPNTFMNLEEGKVIAELQPQLKSYTDQMLAKWIVNGGVDEEWEGYVEQLKAMGLDRYVEQFQAALDRFNAQ